MARRRLAGRLPARPRSGTAALSARRPGAAALAVVAAVALALLAAGCGGAAGAGTEGVATAGGAKAADTAGDGAAEKKDPQQAGLDFAKCMREHGVDVPDPQFSEGGSGGDGFIRVGPGPSSSSSEEAAGPAGGPPPGFEEADKACRHFLEDLVQDAPGPIDAEAQDRMLEFAKCMREHGVDMPDPDFSGGKGGFRAQIGAKGMDPSSGTFQDAQKACGSLFGPDRPGGPGGPVVRGSGPVGAAPAGGGSS